MAKTVKGEIVREYIDKFPKHATHALAKAIYAHNKKVFKDGEEVRSLVRYYRGASGKAVRKHAVQVIPPKDRLNPYNLPQSYADPVPPFVLPVGCNNILVIQDLHIPYHDVKAITAALNYGKEQKVNTIVINGDLIDFHQISRFQKDPRKRSVKQEFDATRQFLVELRRAFPRAHIYYNKGNHCVRWEYYLMSKAPEIFDDPYFELENRLQLNSVRVHLLSDKTIIKAGGLSITHGHTILRGIFAPVNAARGVFLKTKQSTLIGHTHKISEHTETTLDGKIITCWSVGCLSELAPDYSSHCNNYSHGFAHVRVAKDGSYSVKNFRIFDGKIL
jgi:predicted phosphodiesterase